MIFLLGFLLIPAAIVATFAPYWQKCILAALVAIYLMWVITRILTYISIGRRKSAPTGVSWIEGRSASDFQGHFINYLQDCGCQVTWSKIADPDRTAFAIQKGKRVVVVLCLSPTAKMKEWDLARVSNWARDQNTNAGVIVTGGRVEDPACIPVNDKTTVILSYADLSDSTWLARVFDKCRPAR